METLFGIFDKFWHKTLKRPYVLSVPIDVGSGVPIVLIHGLAGSTSDWKLAMPELEKLGRRIIAIDLLGSSSSPKPEWVDYSTVDHAQAVIATLKSLRLEQPAVLVGHSMGALIAVRVARLQPDLVSQLILYELPTYVDLPEIKSYSVFHRGYRSLFEFAIKNSNETIQVSRVFGRFVSHMLSGRVDADNWTAFSKSLRNTVLDKYVHEDLRQISVPIHMIFGKFDFLVLERPIKKLYKNSPNIQFYSLSEMHVITKKTGKMISSILDQKSK